MVPTAGAALAAAAGSYRALFIILAATSAFSAVLVRTAALSSRSPAENDVLARARITVLLSSVPCRPGG